MASSGWGQAQPLMRWPAKWYTKWASVPMVFQGLVYIFFGVEKTESMNIYRRGLISHDTQRSQPISIQPILKHDPKDISLGPK